MENHIQRRPGSDEAPAKLKTTWLVFKTVLARLRFLAILAAIGLVIIYWSTFVDFWDKLTRPMLGQEQASSDTEFYCPMHPQIIRDHPDHCPICGMPLSKRQKGEGQDEALPAGVIQRVQLAPYRVALAGVQTSEITYRPLTKEIDTVGFIEFDERKQAHIAARQKSRVDKLFINVTGEMVKHGEPLAVLNVRNNPDLLYTIQNLRDALKSGNKQDEELIRKRLLFYDFSGEQFDLLLLLQDLSQALNRGDAKEVQALRERLRSWGQAREHHVKLDEKHAKQLEGLLGVESTAPLLVVIASPIEGHVILKHQVEGKYVDEGTPLYDVADLSTVWLQTQIYEDDLALLSLGQEITATMVAFPNREFRGKVVFIDPHLDQATRTLRVRFDIDNPEHELRPGMTTRSVRIRIPVTTLDRAGPGSGLLLPLFQTAVHRWLLQQGLVPAVPETAIIDTGNRKIVYREVETGVYDALEIEVGPRSGAYYPLVRGLQVGDRVVTHGSFLIDAETRLNPAAGSLYAPPGAAGKAGASGQVLKSRGEDAKVKASLALLSAEERRLAEAQEFCPITEKRLGWMGKPITITLKGQKVFLCCKACEDEAKAKPDETLEKVEKFKRAKAATGKK